MGKIEEAERDIKKSVELNPNNIYALNSMAELYAAKGIPEEACEWLIKAISKGYNNWNYLKNSKTYDPIRNHPCFKAILERKI